MSLTKFAVATVEHVFSPTKEVTARVAAEKLAYQPPDHLVFTPDNVYTLVRAISARVNKNWDGFPKEEILGAITDPSGKQWPPHNETYGYPTFRGKFNHIDHFNTPLMASLDKRHNPRGLILDSTYHEDPWDEGGIPHIANVIDPVAVAAGEDCWVRLLIANNRNKWPKLCEAIERGHKDPTDPQGLSKVSMGCEVIGSWCSICGNFARHEFEYCLHVSAKRGKLQPAEADSPYVEMGIVQLGEMIPAFEKNHGLTFFEESWITDEQADPTAVTLEPVLVETPKVAAGPEDDSSMTSTHGPPVRVNVDGDDVRDTYAPQETDDPGIRHEMDYSRPPNEQPGEHEPTYPFPCSAIVAAMEAPENQDYPFNPYIDVSKCQGCMYNDSDKLGFVECTYDTIVREDGKDPLPTGFEPPGQDDEEEIPQTSGFLNEDGTPILALPKDRKASEVDPNIEWIDR